jgi:hypothetical protein
MQRPSAVTPAPSTPSGLVTEGRRPLLAKIALILELNLDDLSEQLLDHGAGELTASEPTWRLELGHPVKRGVAAALRDALARLTTRAEPPFELPPETLHAAQLWARAGFDLGILLSVCFVAGESFWDEFERAMESLSPAAEAALEAQKRAQRSLAGYSARLQELLSSAYAREIRLISTDGERRRSQMVSHILAGARPRAGELGYEFAQHHLGFISFGDDARAQADGLTQQPRRRLLASASDGSIWGWIGSRRPFTPDDMAAIVESARVKGSQMAFGEPGHGADGFRRSHRQALQASAAIMAVAPETIARYRDTSLLALLQGCDAAAAREFMEYELAGLLDGDARSADLRRTLEVHLDQGQRIGATGAVLGIDRHTARDRLDEIERRIRSRISDRSAGLRAALLLYAAQAGGLAAGTA